MEKLPVVIVNKFTEEVPVSTTTSSEEKVEPEDKIKEQVVSRTIEEEELLELSKIIPTSDPNFADASSEGSGLDSYESILSTSASLAQLKISIQPEDINRSR
uniref:Ovule protein n=1 Tax=Rhabditophanes sp. KR3021 TaxID=114890 RepID=A0AC35U3P6_9BILA